MLHFLNCDLIAKMLTHRNRILEIIRFVWVSVGKRKENHYVIRMQTKISNAQSEMRCSLFALFYNTAMSPFFLLVSSFDFLIEFRMKCFVSSSWISISHISVLSFLFLFEFCIDHAIQQQSEHNWINQISMWFTRSIMWIFKQYINNLNVWFRILFLFCSILLRFWIKHIDFVLVTSNNIQYGSGGSKSRNSLFTEIAAK